MNSFNELAIQSATYCLNIETSTDDENLNVEDIQKNFETAINSKLKSTQIYENKNDTSLPDADAQLERNVITNIPYNLYNLPKGTIFDYITNIQNVTPDYFQIPAKNKHFIYDKEKPSVYELKSSNNIPFDIPFFNMKQNSDRSNIMDNNSYHPKELSDMIDFTLSEESFKHIYKPLIERLTPISYENDYKVNSLIQKYIKHTSFDTSQDTKQLISTLNSKKDLKQISEDDVVLALIIQINNTEPTFYNNVDDTTLVMIIDTIKSFIHEKMTNN